MTEWEYDHERKACILFEFDSRVTRYWRPEHTYNVHVAGRKPAKFTPDFFVELITREIIVVEIKPAAESERKEVRQRLLWVEEQVRTLGYRYDVVVDTELGRNPRLSNLQLLMRYRDTWRPPLPGGLDHAIRSPRLTFSQLKQIVGDKVTALTLLANGYLVFDYASEQLSETTELCVPGGPLDKPSIHGWRNLLA